MTQTTAVALAIFAITYILIFAIEKARPYIALASAVIFVGIGALGVLDGFSYGPLDALLEIDWNVLMMIAGTMGTVQLFINSGMPKRMSDIIISKTGSVRWMIVAMSLFAGLVSAFVDNVATVLMIAPVALAICKRLGISPGPTIICISISSNLQGAATLVGDTTSILLAKAAGLDFMDFFFYKGRPGMFWVTEAGAIVSAIIIIFMFRKERGKIESNERAVVEDKVPTVLLVLTILSLIAVSFIPYQDVAQPGQFCKPAWTNGALCLFFFAIGLIRECIKKRSVHPVKKALWSLDGYTLLLLGGLFVVIGGIKRAGVIDLLAQGIFSLCGGSTKASLFVTFTVIVWLSVLISAFIDNIPYVATMLPVVASLSSQFAAASSGDFENAATLLYFGLLVGATLGGNLTPVGASANITGIGILRREGYTVKSSEFMKYSVPFTLAAVATGYVLLWVIWA